MSNSKYKDTCANALKIIETLDQEFEVIDNTPCCGALAFNTASETDLKEHVKFVNKWFKLNEVSEIVTICAGCYNYLSRFYPLYLGNDFKIEIKHILQFIAQPENLERLNLKHSGKLLKVSYHDACHLRNAEKPIIEEPRIIFNSIENVELEELDNNKTNSICCGAGGGVYSIFKENSDHNSKLIFDQLKRGKALITACPFCYTAFKRIKDDNQIRKTVLKFEDFIIKIIEGVDPLVE